MKPALSFPTSGHNTRTSWQRSSQPPQTPLRGSTTAWGWTSMPRMASGSWSLPFRHWRTNRGSNSCWTVPELIKGANHEEQLAGPGEAQKRQLLNGAIKRKNFVWNVEIYSGKLEYLLAIAFLFCCFICSWQNYWINWMNNTNIYFFKYFNSNFGSEKFVMRSFSWNVLNSVAESYSSFKEICTLLISIFSIHNYLLLRCQSSQRRQWKHNPLPVNQQWFIPPRLRWRGQHRRCQQTSLDRAETAL